MNQLMPQVETLEDQMGNNSRDLLTGWRSTFVLQLAQESWHGRKLSFCLLALPPLTCNHAERRGCDSGPLHSSQVVGLPAANYPCRAIPS
jgi:hypothetical protein